MWACSSNKCRQAPTQDYVFVTAVTLVNKTLPRLLQLSRHAFVTLVGPSTPLTPLLFREGISQLAGTVVVDEEQIWHNVAEGGERSIFQVGARMITVTPADAKT